MRNSLATSAIAILLAICSRPAAAAADDARNAAVRAAVREFLQPGQIELPIGVTAQGTLIWCLLPSEALQPARDVTRVLIVSGLDGDPQPVEALKTSRGGPLLPPDQPGRYLKVWIPLANPDAWYDCVHTSAAPRPLRFPPTGTAYNTAGAVEAAVLTRFIDWLAPDAVVEMTSEDDPLYRRTLLAQQAGMEGAVDYADDGLIESLLQPKRLIRAAVAGGVIPAHLLRASPATFDRATRDYVGLDRFDASGGHRSELARLALARLERSPSEVADQLLDHYGHELKTAMYQPALALCARLRFGELTGNPSHREAVGRILNPYLDGQRPALDDKSNGSHFAGQLVFAAWARQPDAPADPRAVRLVQAAADRAFTADGQPREAMPTHNDMSDAVFMACPILTAAGRLTGDPKYFDMAGRHLTFMQERCLRADGLYRHSPLCEAAWGRGNGFPALGLALSLSELEPVLEEHAAAPVAILPGWRESAARLQAQMLDSYRRHLSALIAHQDPTGCWRQVVDHPGAYRELTATCMITFAMARGLRRGWLDEATFRPVVDRAWDAIRLRVYEDGVLLDVCTGTGKQPSLQHYLDREAIYGQDERGGAMALLVAVELAERE